MWALLKNLWSELLLWYVFIGNFQNKYKSMKNPEGKQSFLTLIQSCLILNTRCENTTQDFIHQQQLENDNYLCTHCRQVRFWKQSFVSPCGRLSWLPLTDVTPVMSHSHVSRWSTHVSPSLDTSQSSALINHLSEHRTGLELKSLHMSWEGLSIHDIIMKSWWVRTRSQK